VVHIENNVQDLIDVVAERLTRLARAAEREARVFHLALSGGNTPRDLYRRLAEPTLSERIPWPMCQLWFGDERCVPPQHPDSNYGMARQTLFGPLGLAARQVHRMHGEAPDPHRAAAAYAEELGALLPQENGWPIFDLVLLGIGPDGHIASLFPGSANLAATDRFVSAAHISEQRGWRISLTLPVIRAARHVLVLAAGATKVDILTRVLARAPSAEDRALPAARLRDLPQLEWYLDRQAAAGLPA
jgi:6-phosphogluconolactonase